MVGHNEEVERPIELRRHASARGDRFASGKAIRVLGAERVADHAGVGRVAGMQMRVAEEDLIGEGFARDRGSIWTSRSAVVAGESCVCCVASWSRSAVGDGYRRP